MIVVQQRQWEDTGCGKFKMAASKPLKKGAIAFPVVRPRFEAIVLKEIILVVLPALKEIQISDTRFTALMVGGSVPFQMLMCVRHVTDELE